MVLHLVGSPIVIKVVVPLFNARAQIALMYPTQVMERLVVRRSIHDFENFNSENVAIVVAPASNSMKNATYAMDKANPGQNEVTEFFISALANPHIVVAANCHGLYAFTPAKKALEGYSVTTNGDMAGEVRAAGATVVPDQAFEKLGKTFVDRNLVRKERQIKIPALMSYFLSLIV